MAAGAISRFERAVEKALSRIQIDRGDLILAGLSGGPDSVALLLSLKDLSPRFGYRLNAAHLNHRIRAEESDRDEAFVRGLCASIGAELAVEEADLPLGSSNLEERARDLRYDFLKRMAARMDARYIALGHHMDDQAETVMLRLMRGAGMAGLSAMGETGPGRLIRPMLKLRHEDAIAYLTARKVDFVSDSSNLSRQLLRNRVRLDLLPLIERDYAPGFSRRLAEISAEMRVSCDFVYRCAADELESIILPDGAIDLLRFFQVDPALRAPVIRILLERRVGSLRRIARSHIEAILKLAVDGSPGGRVDIYGGWQAVRDYGVMAIARRPPAAAAAAYATPILLDGRTVIDAARFAFEAETMPADSVSMPSSQFQALFDAEQIIGIMARSFIPGDRIRPLKLGGTRKVKEIFIERKIARSKRAAYPIVVINDAIAWLPGLVRGDVALLNAGTNKVLRVKAFPIAPG